MSSRSLLILPSFGLTVILSLAASGQTSGESIQIPPSVQMQLNSYQDRFQQVLAEECPQGLCTPAGCEVTQFITLDEQQDSSLPGLETPKETTTSPQYRLVGVRCELAHESTLSSSALNSLKQRLQTKIKTAGTSLSLVLRKLSAKAPELTVNPNKEGESGKPAAPSPETGTATELSVWQRLTPWMVFSILLTLLALLLIWGYRTIGKIKSSATSERAPQSDTAAKDLVPTPEPTAQMLIERISQLKAKLLIPGNRALRTLLSTEDIESLCQVLQHFGAEALADFSKQVEYQDVLKKVRTEFQSFPQNQSNGAVWNFLDKIDRLLVANDLTPPENTLQEDAAFLQTLEGDEFFHLLQRVPEEDLPMVLSFSPQHLQNTFIKRLDPLQRSNLLERITQARDLPDQMARQKLSNLKQIYLNHRPELKRIAVDRTPLLEQLLNSMSAKDRLGLIKQLQNEESGLITGLMPHLFLDESLMSVPSDLLNEIFLQVAPEKAAAYIDSLPFAEPLMQRLHQNLRQSIQRWRKLNGGGTKGIDFKMDASMNFVEDPSSELSALPSFKMAEMGRNEIARGVRDQVTRGQLNLQTINEAILRGSSC